MTNKVFRPRNFLVVIMLLVLAAVAYGFAATNNVEGSAAGDGSEAVSGYDITNIHYVLDSGNPALVSSVQFQMAVEAGGAGDDAATVYVELDSDAGNWYSCNVSSYPTVTCDLSGGSVSVGSTFTELRVVAAQ
jgi:hypothetical protein